MKNRCAVVSCKGLGDGLLSLFLAHQLHCNGWQAEVYHGGTLRELQPWFPHLPILPFLNQGESSSLFTTYERLFVSYDRSSPFISSLIQEGKNLYPQKIFVLNPSPSSRIGTQPYYQDSAFDPSLCMVENLLHFCQKKIGLEKMDLKGGWSLPSSLSFRKNPSRVVISPTSGREGKNWPLERFLQLASQIQQEGWEPVIVVSQEEERLRRWQPREGLPFRSFSSLDGFASFLYESGFWIGNDSGGGHLASRLGIPTVSLFRHWRTARLWRPGWTQGKVIFPSKWIPNPFFYRIRDRHWTRWVSLHQVKRAFKALA